MAEFLALAAALVGAGVLLRVSAPKPEPIAADPDMGILVETLTVASVPLEYRIEVSGIVEARRESRAGFELGGQVAAVLFADGDFIEAGQVIARLDTAIPFQ